MELHIWLVSALVFLITVASSQESIEWICNKNTNLCSKETSPSTKVNETSYENQNVCQLSCGIYGSIWPQPTGQTVLSPERIYFDPWKIRFNLVAPNPQTSQYLGEINKIFIGNILKECNRNCSLAESKEVLVKLTVNSSSTVLDWTTDESYSINLRSSDKVVYVDIRGYSIYGVRHGLETFSHLITGKNGNGLATLSYALVKDIPKYKHRGLLLDTARNFISLKYIKSTLDGMATSKLNVFHWHVTDSQSFPLEISKVPHLHKYGAYSPSHVYTRNDTQHIVKYAKLRGIRVLIELDAPAHAGNGWEWGNELGLGHLAVCVNQQPWRKYCIEPPCGQLNPLNDNVYSVLKEVFEDINEMIAPEETIHMGGDEIYINCWNSTEEITKKMAAKGMNRDMNSFYKIWSDFHAKNLHSWDEVNKVEKPVILWSSHLTDPKIIRNYLPKERYIVQTWVPAADTLNKELTQLGYQLIISTKNAWYLDHGFWGQTQYYNWRTVYNNRIFNSYLVLGGEVCMWTEFVDDQSVESRIWPRAGAAAERLWANPSTNANSAESRFYRFRERLISRGIRPSAVTPKWCTLNEGQCD